MSGSKQSRQEGVYFESASSSGSNSEGSSDDPKAYSFKQSGTDSVSSSETSSDNSEDRLSKLHDKMLAIIEFVQES